MKNKVLFWVPGGMPLMLHVEGAIAIGLKKRNVDVQAVICDGPFRACVKREIKDGTSPSTWALACKQCKESTMAVLDKMQIPYSFIGSFVKESDRQVFWNKVEGITYESLASLEYEGVNIGKNAQSAIIRYLQGSPLNGNEIVVREYAYSALVAAAAAKNAYGQLSPERVFMSHGTYIDWGPALQIAMNLNIPVVAWMASYLTGRFYFRQVEDNIRIDFHNLNKGTWPKLKSYGFSVSQKEALDTYLHKRYLKNVSFDMKKFQLYSGASDTLRNKYQIRADKPLWGIMCHINWDAVSDYSPMTYPSFDDWIIDTVKIISKIDSVDWIIKVHPAESWDNPATGVQVLLEKHFPTLPDHVRIIKAEEEINPLDFFQMIDGGVTVYGTSGLELTLQGKPVILAGEAHYGDKGFTYDGLTPASYRDLLERASTFKKLTEDQLESARIYAYCYFLQRQIPFPVVKDPDTIWWQFQEHKAHLLEPGKDPFTDFICERVMDGKDFIMSEALIKNSETVYNLSLGEIFCNKIRKLKRGIMAGVRKMLPAKMVYMIKNKKLAR